MTYPYEQNSYFPNGEVTRYEEIVACTTVAADGSNTFNIPPGERVVDLSVVGVASVSGVAIKAYAFSEPTQNATLAKILDVLAIGSGTSATVITQATSSVAPTSMFRVTGFDEAAGLDGIQLPFGMYVSVLISSVTATTGSATVYVTASPRS